MSDLIIKKNGTDYKLPMLAEHYPADRVYLDGDTSKTVQDAVDTLTQNETGDYIDLTSYTQDWYTFPSDGYLLSSTSDNASMTVRLRGATSGFNINSLTKNGENDVIYVRKGMRAILYASTGSVALRFYSFTS